MLENRTEKRHQTQLTLDVKGTGNWTLSVDGEILQPRLKNGKKIFNIDVRGAEHKILLEKAV